ncbi:hypothetical protein SAOR_14320 [Salinisphaera orenii MK-B5]|uniref:Sel1 repeat family protein n=1 Tax=Salinisphaera orenii MK-B5 TaxID=856730 RepID=A0A423PGP3_9GAMM|nr:hypothetical protein SAOR_14320 [Salinisphaera orenii MK-B5]
MGRYSIGVLQNGAPQNDVDSTLWYLKAAKQAHVDSQINLAAKHAQGRE